jgi:hypothetical protein
LCYLNTISMYYSTVDFIRYLIISSNLIVLDVMIILDLAMRLC